jgi:hypothetical protein
MFNCLHCNKEFNYKRNTKNKYCNNKCSSEHFAKLKVNNWLEGKIEPTKAIVARYLKENKGYNCDECNLNEWNGKSITLEIDHIDGNSFNNCPSNFRYICPNCHSQTSTFKGGNRGNGRPKETKNYTFQRSLS